MRVRLRDPATALSWHGWTINGGQAKALPDGPCPELRARLAAGFLVLVEPKQTESGVPMVRPEK